MSLLFKNYSILEVIYILKKRPLFMDEVQLPQGKSHFEEALFTTQFSEIPGSHFIDLGRMKG